MKGHPSVWLRGSILETSFIWQWWERGQRGRGLSQTTEGPQLQTCPIHEAAGVLRGGKVSFSAYLVSLNCQGTESMHKKVRYGKVKSLSRVRLFATPWTVAHQAPPSTGFSSQEYWSGLPFNKHKEKAGLADAAGIQMRMTACTGQVHPPDLFRGSCWGRGLGTGHNLGSFW